ncbi:MAG: NAD(P)/FAD-dependent oxidoreductase [Vicinamibacterales bacterium]
MAITRRSFFHAVGAGLALAARPARLSARAPGHIAIVGGGIIGASMAYHLARRGARVTVLERATPGSGATANSFAWINAGSKRPRGYHELNRLGMHGWRRLQHELGGDRLVVQWGGTVQWTRDHGAVEAFRAEIVAQQRWGYGTRLVDAAELRRLVPLVEPGPVEAASFCEEEGTVDPVAATEALLEAARGHGATVRHPAAVTGFDANGARVRGVRLGAETIAADAVVLATGVDLPALARQLGVAVPMKDSPGLLAHTRPHRRLLERVVVAPGATIKQLPSGKIVSGVDFGGSPSLDTSTAMGQRLITGASRYLPALAEAALDRVTLGWRVMPADGHPIVGRIAPRSNVYVAAMHSGITLAPAIGQIAAIELLDELEVDLLAPYRLSRFATA